MHQKARFSCCDANYQLNVAVGSATGVESCLVPWMLSLSTLVLLVGRRKELHRHNGNARFSRCVVRGFVLHLMLSVAGLLGWCKAEGALCWDRLVEKWCARVDFWYVLLFCVAQVSSSKKLPCLYLIDSIMKNIQKGPYLKLFMPNIVNIFCAVFEKVGIMHTEEYLTHPMLPFCWASMVFINAYMFLWIVYFVSVKAKGSNCM